MMNNEVKAILDRSVELGQHGHMVIGTNQYFLEGNFFDEKTIILKQSAGLASRNIMITYWEVKPLSGQLMVTLYNYGRWNYSIGNQDIIANINIIKKEKAL